MSETSEAYSAVDELAEWSPWADFSETAATAPTVPGVYMMRADDRVIYVGMAGERSGKGMRGRLAVYRTGKGAVSGFGEAVLDRALADEQFLRKQLDALVNGTARRAKTWAKDAIAWVQPELRWAIRDNGDAAGQLEDAVVEILRAHGIWNRVALQSP